MMEKLTSQRAWGFAGSGYNPQGAEFATVRRGSTKTARKSAESADFIIVEADGGMTRTQRFFSFFREGLGCADNLLPCPLFNSPCSS